MKNIFKNQFFLLIILILTVFAAWFLFWKWTNKPEKIKTINETSKKITEKSTLEKSDNSFLNSLSDKTLKDKFAKLNSFDKNKAEIFKKLYINKELNTNLSLLAIDHILEKKSLTQEIETLKVNFKFLMDKRALAPKDAEINNTPFESNESKPFAYVFYIIWKNNPNITDKILSDYTELNNYFGFLSNPTLKNKFVEEKSIALALYEYKKWNKPDTWKLDEFDLIKYNFVSSKKGKLITRNDFKEMLLKASKWADIYNFNIIDAFWIDLLYIDITKMSKDDVINLVIDNYYDYLLIDKMLFDNSFECWNIKNWNIKELCDWYAKKNDKLIDKYNKIMNDYLLYIVLNKNNQSEIFNIK